MDENGHTWRERVREEAAKWVVRLAEPHGLPDRAAFDAWREADVQHEIAYQRALMTWERLDRLRALRPADGIAPSPVPFTATGRAARGFPAGSYRGWRAIAAGLLVLASAGSVLVATLAGSPAFATSIGERRLIRLDDGSSVELNTDSKVVVRYDHGKREVDLVRGEAMFHAARDARPFTIHADRSRLDASNADVTVRLVDQTAHVIVSAGSVLASAWGNAPDSRRITAIAAHSAADVRQGHADIHGLTPDELDRSLAWREGAIALDGQTLAAAAREFNRYNLRKIEIADPATANLHVGGYFRVADVNGFVAALAQALPVQATMGADGNILLASRN